MSCDVVTDFIVKGLNCYSTLRINMYVCALNSWRKKLEDVSIWSDKLLNVKCIKLGLNSQNCG